MNDWVANLDNYLLLFMLIFTRWMIMSIMIPFLGAALLPPLVRVGLAAFLSLISFLMLFEDIVFSNLSTLDIMFLLSKEVVIGFILGLYVSLIFYAYELIGQFIDIARAASTLKLFVPELKQQSSAMGTLFFQLALVLFFSLRLHAPAIEGLYLSFERFPVFSFANDFLSSSFLAATVRILASLFELALRLSLPIVFVCFLIDLAFGFLNRVAPQINAYFLSLPVKMMGGLIMLFFIIPLMFSDFISHHEEMMRFFKAMLIARP